MLKPGKYKTAHGSKMEITGAHGGISSVDFNWLEEDACCDCKPEPYNSDGYLVWHCESCGGGKAELIAE